MDTTTKHEDVDACATQTSGNHVAQKENLKWWDPLFRENWARTMQDVLGELRLTSVCCFPTYCRHVQSWLCVAIASRMPSKVFRPQVRPAPTSGADLLTVFFRCCYTEARLTVSRHEVWPWDVTAFHTMYAFFHSFGCFACILHMKPSDCATKGSSACDSQASNDATGDHVRAARL